MIAGEAVAVEGCGDVKSRGGWDRGSGFCNEAAG